MPGVGLCRRRRSTPAVPPHSARGGSLKEPFGIAFLEHYGHSRTPTRPACKSATGIDYSALPPIWMEPGEGGMAHPLGAPNSGNGHRILYSRREEDTK